MLAGFSDDYRGCIHFYQETVPLQSCLTIAFAKGCLDSCQVASTQLDVGVVTLKRVCHVKNINRRPFHKRKRLGIPIERTKQALDDGTGKALDDGTGKDNMQKLAVVKVLHK